MPDIRGTEDMSGQLLSPESLWSVRLSLLNIYEDLSFLFLNIYPGVGACTLALKNIPYSHFSNSGSFSSYQNSVLFRVMFLLTFGEAVKYTVQRNLTVID